jgi:sulfate transport system ATP-binding protein
MINIGKAYDMSIEVRKISKNFGGTDVLKSVDFIAGTGELLALLGPSGSGKTTLLRIIAGLEAADTGSVLFHGEDATQTGAKERKVGFVFQHYALFRHMTVLENISFGLNVMPRRTRPPKNAIRRKAEGLLELVQLGSFSKHYPSQLSGGQRQRVALARALAVEPKLLLLDEPFGALDAKVRRELRQWLRRLHDELHITSIFVTHDQEEALELADKIVVMNHGKVEQIGTPDEVYHSPATPFMFEFLGNVNIFHGRAEDDNMRILNTTTIYPQKTVNSRGRISAYIRPHHFEVRREKNGNNDFPATLSALNQTGLVVKLEFETDLGCPINVEMTTDKFLPLNLKRGEKVFLEPKEVRVFPANGAGET